MRAQRALGIAAGVMGALLLLVHLFLHPVPVSASDLQEAPPSPGARVVLTTDSTLLLETMEDGTKIVALDQFARNAVLVAPPFEPSFASGRLAVLDATWPADPSYEERAYAPAGEPAPYTVLTNVVWRAERAQEMPPPWLAAAGVALLGASFAAFRPDLGVGGAGALAGFLAAHFAGRSTLLFPLLVVWSAALFALVVTAALSVFGLWRRRAGRLAPWLAALPAFFLGAWLEMAFLGGYRPFTGIY